MSEEQQGTPPQAEATAQDQESAQNTQNAEGQQGAQDNGTQEQQETTQETTRAAKEPTSVEELPKWARDEMKSLRKENANRRASQKEQQSEEATQLRSVSEERDTLRQENDALKRQVQRSAFIEAIALPNARAAWGYVLDGTVEVEYDENNRPKNLDAIRKALREEDGALFGNGSADGGRTTTTGNGHQGQPGLERLRHAYGANT